MRARQGLIRRLKTLSESPADMVEKELRALNLRHFISEARAHARAAHVLSPLPLAQRMRRTHAACIKHQAALRWESPGRLDAAAEPGSQIADALVEAKLSKNSDVKKSVLVRLAAPPATMAGRASLTPSARHPAGHL